MLVSSVSALRQYFTAIGADNPEQPPQPCGLAVSSQISNAGLVADCIALLRVKDALRGAATLNWATSAALSTWDGISSGGTPSRVVRVELPNKSLDGFIPAQLVKLGKLTHLDLNGNALTGEIPQDLSYLQNLISLKLSGNSLSGCVPSGLKSITTNDLASLSILACLPAPSGLNTGTIGETRIALSWNAVPNAAKYRVERLDKENWGDKFTWDVVADAITGTSHTVDGLRCPSRPWFRLRAYRNGTLSAAEWGAPSGLVKADMTTCLPPVFDSTSYAFSVPDEARIGDSVGAVLATGSEGADDTVTYSINAGNEDGKFALDASTGQITVAEALSGLAGTTYTFTVEAVDESGDAATVTATVAVT